MIAGYAIRRMSRADLGLALDWAAAEGWNPGLHDADSFLACDPDGYFVGESDGRAIAVISAVTYGDAFGFIGLYIVGAKEERGKGYGLQVWNAAMARLGGRSAGLDGVVERQDDYHKSGFVLAHRNQRFEGVGGGFAPTGTVPAAEVPFDLLAAYDAAAFAFPRPGFLKPWIAQPEGTALVLCRRGRIEGYGVLRQCRRGFKIGPLFADEPEGAETLFAALAARCPGQPIYLDLPQPNTEALALAGRHGMRPVFETARMYRGRAPDLPLSRIYGITTYELG